MKKIILIFIVVSLFLSCKNQPINNNKSVNNKEGMQKKHTYTNSLINETSPYLLQHAYNPVSWYPWGKEAFDKAKKEDKLVLISIGYSACHWCHVMEHESFEDSTVAQLMNDNFICIKVDREERPDVDQIYMDAVQKITGSGGWPLNCFALPDGRPFYGGTYFPKDNWMKLLSQLSDAYKKDKKKIEGYAENLTKGIVQEDNFKGKTGNIEFDKKDVSKIVDNWKKNMDLVYGGNNGSPKFPLPNNYEFLLHYAHLHKDTSVMNYVHFSLEKMAYGGIFDQVSGGFARYSTDVHWKVPHFEKMLYDNGQLVSLYSRAFQQSKNPLYKEVVEKTIQFLEEELTDKENCFYSALDADSEGEEGKYYVWTKEELKQLLGGKFAIAKSYYNVNNYGYWEHDNYILIRNKSKKEVAKEFNISIDKLDKEVTKINSILKKERLNRIMPGLDDKTLTSWNAIMCRGLLDACQVFGETKYLALAEKNMNFILAKMQTKNGELLRTYKNGKSKINGFLEDYSFTIEALIALYENTQDEKWLDKANILTQKTIELFFDKKSKMFFYTPKNAEALISRKIEIQDNVIPSSNSSMAKALFLLGEYLDSNSYKNMADEMLTNIYDYMPNYGPSFSNWGILLMNRSNNFYEIAVTGSDYKELIEKWNEQYIPNKILLGAKQKSNLPLLKGKFINKKGAIFVCVNKACKLPTTEFKKAFQLIK